MISLEMTSLKDTKLFTLASPSFWESPYSWTPVTLLSFASDDLHINHKKTGFNEFHSFQCDLYAGHPLGFLLEKKKQASIITHSSLSLFFWSKGSRAKDLSYLANHETHKNLLSRPMTSPFFTFGNHQAMLKDGLLFEYLT